MHSWKIRLVIGLAALGARPAMAVESREATTFVYPQSPTNTYRLPQYPLKGTEAPGLSRCGEAAGEGLRFEPDGQTFHLDPPPDRLKGGSLRRALRVQRGKSGCFKAEVVIIVPLLAEPDPATWTIEWSPERPEAIDVVVPSTPLAQDPAMQQAHSLVFPWSNQTLVGKWADCANGCRWRIIADEAVRRAFLTRAEVPVRINAKSIAGLGSSAGIFNSDGSKRAAPQEVKLSRWKISPNIQRTLIVEKGQLEVPLTFPGAWALKPSPSGSKGARIEQGPTGLILRFDTPKDIPPPFELIPGGGQLKAYIGVRRTGQRLRVLSYWSRFGNLSARLPPGVQICTPGPNNYGRVGAVRASSIPAPFIERGEQCGRDKTKRLAVTLYEPVLHANDVEAVALDWSPEAPLRLDLYIKSKALVQSSAIREDTKFVVGDHPEGQFLGCLSDYCQYRIEEFDGARSLRTPPITIVSKRVSAEGTPRLDPVTGLPFETQRVAQRKLGWRVKDKDIVVGVPFFEKDTRATGTVPSQVARFFASGPVPCSANGSCELNTTDDGTTITITGQGALTAATVTVPSVPLEGISLFQVRSETFRRVETPRLKVKMSTCAYEMRQLTRAIAGLREATILYQARLKPGARSEFCPGQDWSVVLSSGERGSAQLKGSLLEVRIETIPVPGDGGSGDIELEFFYPTGKRVKVAEDAKPKLGVEAAPVLGAPRVSVRLPGDDLRPVATTLAVNRPNILYFDALQDPDNWGVELARARSLYRSCRASGELQASAQETPGTELRDDDSYGSYCIIPKEKTNDTLKLRFYRQGKTASLLRTGVELSALPKAEQDVFLRAGWIDVETGRVAQPWSIAMDLVARTTMLCGTRVVGTASGIVPRAVNFDDFDTCVVRVELGAPARTGPPDRTPLEDTIDFYGDQKIVVRGRLLDADDNSGSTVLTTVRLRRESKDQQVLIIPVSLSEIGNKPPGDYAVVEVEIAHAENFYAPDEKWSMPNSVARLRIRRGPEYLAFWNDGGRGIRMFGAFTAVPFSIFRFPHSGKGEPDSQRVEELEQANVGLGVVGVLEAWNFDHNEAIIPVINPQLQIGALVSSNPTTGDLTLPGISLIAGLGLRTGVGTNPGKSLETALKTVIWYEMLFQRAGRRNDPSHNLLFGFTVDLGSTPN